MKKIHVFKIIGRLIGITFIIIFVSSFFLSFNNKGLLITNIELIDNAINHLYEFIYRPKIVKLTGVITAIYIFCWLKLLEFEFEISIGNTKLIFSSNDL